MGTVVQTGPNSFRGMVRKKGHKQVHQTFKNEEPAKAEKLAWKWVKDTEREIKLGGSVHTKRTSKDTVAKAIEVFRDLREAKRPIRPQGNEFYTLRYLESGLGEVRLHELGTDTLLDYAKKRARGGVQPSTIAGEISKLGTVLKFASINLKAANPDVVKNAMPTLEYHGLLGTSRERDRRPTAAELKAVLAHLEPLMQDIVKFAIASALRRAEICRILWDDVDEAKHLVLVRDRKDPRKKDGNHQWVPLIDATGFDAWAILKAQPRTDSLRIFPISPEGLSDRFLTACRVAGIEDLHFHDLRHEATSRLFESGLSIEKVSLVTGHTNWQHLRRYTQLRPESLTIGIHRDTPQRPDSPQTGSPSPGTSAP